jgi:hypothetical protein
MEELQRGNERPSSLNHQRGKRLNCRGGAGRKEGRNKCEFGCDLEELVEFLLIIPFIHLPFPSLPLFCRLFFIHAD